MYSCVVCHEDESREESVDEVFEVDDTCLCVACLRRCAAPLRRTVLQSRNDREGAQSRRWRYFIKQSCHHGSIRIRIRQLSGRPPASYSVLAEHFSVGPPPNRTCHFRGIRLSGVGTVGSVVGCVPVAPSA